MEQLAPHLPGILLAWTAFFLAVVSPGPAVLATIGTSMTKGRKAGVAQACGTVSTSFFLGSMAAIGLGSLLLQYAYAIVLLKILGGVYLLWLAFKSFRSASREPQLTAKTITHSNSLWRYYLQGVLIHIANPKPIFAWLATIALGVSQSSPPAVYFLIVIGGTLISLTINLTYAVSFSTDTVARTYARLHRWFEITFGLMFTAAGIKLLLSAKQN